MLVHLMAFYTGLGIPENEKMTMVICDFHVCFSCIQSSAVIMRFNFVRYYINDAGAEKKYQSDAGSTKDTTYLALTGDL